MGGNMSRVVGCFAPHDQHDKVAVYLSEPFDEGLGHSFCYVRPISAPSPPHCNKGFDSGTGSNGVLRSNLDNNATCSHDPHRVRATTETSFKTISGASVSANTSTPRTITSREQFSSFANVSYDRAAAFEATASFTSIPLQPVPRGLSQSGPITIGSQPSGPLDRGFLSGPIERGFLSGPLERGFLSGPLERGCVSAPMEAMDRSLFSAPLTSSSYYAAYLRRRRRSLAHLVRNLGHPVKKVLSRSLSKTTMQLVKTQKSLTAPVKLLWGMSKYSTRDGSSQCECPLDSGYVTSSSDSREGHNLQWAQGKAGEDRVHVVLSDEHGWLFVGIYDGFSGPDAPDFLMSNLYKEVYRELRGLLWDTKEAPANDEREEALDNDQRDSKHAEGHPRDPCNTFNTQMGVSVPAEGFPYVESVHAVCGGNSFTPDTCTEGITCEMLQKDVRDAQAVVCGLGHSGEGDNASMGVEPPRLDIQHCEDCAGTMMDTDNPSTSLQSSHVPPGKGKRIWFGRSLSELKLRKLRRRRKDQKKVPNADVDQDENNTDNYKRDTVKQTKSSTLDHSAVLNALTSALVSTEKAFFQMADYSIREMPELALMGSCVLVVLMKGADVYVMNVGDSRAILAQLKNEPKTASLSARSQVYDMEKIGARDTQLRQELERIMEETPSELETFESAHACSSTGPPATSPYLRAIQLTVDHSTNVEQEVLRIQAEHPDDKSSISNERVKGRLKVSRAFGAGFLKLPRWNDALLEMFRVDYVGTAPYVTCIPSVHHHALGPNDRFLVLSSDGLYQYLSNEEVVSQVEWFMETYPDGDPAQYLIEELLFRAAKKAGMDFHELLDIPQGDRRKYHDDVSVMVISLEGRIWRSFG